MAFGLKSHTEETAGEKHTDCDGGETGENERDFAEHRKHAANRIQNRAFGVGSKERMARCALHQAGTIWRGLKNPAATRTPRLRSAHGTGAS